MHMSDPKMSNNHTTCQAVNMIIKLSLTNNLMHQKVIQKDDSVVSITTINLEMYIKFPEIPLDMSVYDDSANEDLEVKQEPMDSDQVKLEESPPELKSEYPQSSCQNGLPDAQLQRVAWSGKLCMVEW